MPRFDSETITALAEGRLDPEEAAALEREIAADPVAAAELAAQRLALEALGTAPPVELTPSERAELRAAVADAIGIAEPEPAPDPVKRAVPWGSLGIAAAALVALVAIVPVAGLLTTGEDEAQNLELAAAVTTTSAVTEAESRSAPAADIAEAPVVGEADLDDGMSLGEEAPAEASGFAASSTSAAPATTSAAAAAPTTTTTVSATTTAALDEEALAALTAELEAIKSDPEAVDALSVAALEEDACWIEDTEIRGDPPPQRFRFDYVDGQLTVVVYFELEEGIAGPFRVWGVPDCADLVVIP